MKRMKKRTVITTEKREVWVIGRDAGAPEMNNEMLADAVGDREEPTVTTDQDVPDQALTQEKGKGK